MAGFVRAETTLALDPLVPALGITFTRITLVGCRLPERVTVDLDLRFTAEARAVARQLNRPTAAPRGRLALPRRRAAAAEFLAGQARLFGRRMARKGVLR
jgi:hypothetical protein